MEGGVAIILLLVVGVIAVVAGVVLYATGALVSLSGKRDDGDGDSHRPRHKRPTDPVQENREFAGVHRTDDEQN
jgi:hypothetical protein